MVRTLRSTVGFSLVDTMMAVAIGAIVCAMAVPAASQALNSMRLSMATRDVERELQLGRLKAVSLNRRMRVRFNCPAGQNAMRLVEITGVSSVDTASNRCDPGSYGYPGPRDNNRATPEGDGPVRYFHSTVTMSGNDVEFLPKGTAMTVIAGSPQAISSIASITLTRHNPLPGQNDLAVIDVNGIGKIKIR